MYDIVPMCSRNGLHFYIHLVVAPVLVMSDNNNKGSFLNKVFQNPLIYMLVL